MNDITHFQTNTELLTSLKKFFPGINYDDSCINKFTKLFTIDQKNIDQTCQEFVLIKDKLINSLIYL